MDNEDFKKFGLGVLGRNPKEAFDYKLPGMATATVVEDPIDWDTGFELPDLPSEDQNGSGSCTEQAFCYDFNSKHGIDLSRNDGYSRIGSPTQPGAYPHEPYWKFDTEGQHMRTNSPDPAHESEEDMKKPVNIAAPRFNDLRVKFWSPPDLAIDTIARMIKTYKGMTGCFNITWEGWSNYEFPRAPRREDTQFAGSHMLWLKGFKKIDGLKKIIAYSSWPVTKKHYIGEDYLFIGSQQAFGFYASEYRKAIGMTEYVVIEYKGKLGIGIFDGGFVETLAWAKDKQQILDLCKAYNVKPIGYDNNGYPLATHSIKVIRS